MSILDTWAPYFSSQVRMQGRALHGEGRVRQLDPKPGEIARAHVRGTDLYTVTIGTEESGGGVTCTCPHFADGFYCRHIWSTLIDLDEREVDDEVDTDAPTIDDVQPRPPKARKRTGKRASTRRREPAWVGRLALLRPGGFSQQAEAGLQRPFQVCYIVDAEMSRTNSGLVVELGQRNPSRNGWSRHKQLKINEPIAQTLREPIDRELCALLLGATWVADRESGDLYDDQRARHRFRLPHGASRAMLERMIGAGRAYIRKDEDDAELTALRWDDREESWRLWMVGRVDGDHLEIDVELRRGDQVMEVNAPQLILGGRDGLLVKGGAVARFDDRGAFRWVSQFRDDMRLRHDDANLRVPLAEVDPFMDRLYMLPHLPEMDLPEGVARQIRTVEPKPHVEFTTPVGARGSAERSRLTANVYFQYEEYQVKPSTPGRFIVPAAAAPPPIEPDRTDIAAEAPAETVAVATVEPIRRDVIAEARSMEQLAMLGFREASDDNDALSVTSRQMTQAVPTLLAEGWRVTADQHVIHHPGPARLSVSSDIDWFELRGSIQYETEDGVQEVPIPQILRAATAGRTMIELGDGSQGLLPQQWLAEHGLLTAIGRLQGDALRFRSTQAALLDALMRENELIDVDERFAEARTKLREYAGIKPIDPPPTFIGKLRPYQCEALGWFEFLRWFGIGGILADDMGLGKTVQVLAMLDAAYDGETRASHKPTLIVAPRSVVFNWIDEAQRFAPTLRVQAYAGTEREALREAFVDHDVIATSYGLMRRDIEQLLEHEFHYVVLDEAQAIKNPNSQSAKAARLVNAEHRLALTGTPVENHLGDLWSIFEYLNPGMLGSSSRFGQLVRNGSVRPKMALSAPDDEDDQDTDQIDEAAEASWQIAQALRPFILRRTKTQVLDDLPEKTEQTIVCEMEPEQRKIYDDLRDHYRGSLLKQLSGSTGPSLLGGSGGGSAMMVLEALLRLRQAACHPGLIDKNRTGDTSAKLEALLESLTELVAEGHKALVFSQFTSMLSIVRDRLDGMNIPHAYLDGRTRNRKEIVDRFQADDDCQVFLISLKAGGLGLNLTAAEYVFILDPWWNPAVEQQAIDRTHRIGQTRHVFAYRMICQDTIEHRIAELQDKKRKLADAIVGGEKSLLSSLTRDDLEMLLS